MNQSHSLILVSHFFAFLLLIIGCSKEVRPEVSLKPKTISIDGRVIYTFYYEEGLLKQKLFTNYSYDTIEQKYVSADSIFTDYYYNEAIIKSIKGTHTEYLFNFINDDLWITEIKNNDTLEQTRIYNYKDDNISRIDFSENEHHLISIYPFLDEKNNIIYSTDENGVKLEEICGNLIWCPPIIQELIGVFEYDLNTNVYSDFGPENRFIFTYDKNSNNRISRVLKDYRYDYEYEYNEYGFPKKVTETRTRVSNGNVSHPRITEYEYLIE